MNKEIVLDTERVCVCETSRAVVRMRSIAECMRSIYRGTHTLSFNSYLVDSRELYDNVSASHQIQSKFVSDSTSCQEQTMLRIN